MRSATRAHAALRRSNTARLPDPGREVVRTIEKVEGGEVVGTAVVVLPPLAGTEEDAGVVAGGRLARLHIEVIGVQGHLAGDGDAALVGAKIVSAGRQAEGSGKPLELAARVAVKRALHRRVVADTAPEIEAG